MALKYVKLTRANIRKLAFGKSITEHGITFVQLTNGDGRWEIGIMVDGIRIHRSIGKESDGVTRTQAENFIEQVRTDARAERLNLPKGRKVVIGFRKAADKYLVRLEEGDGKDLYNKKFRFNHLKTFFHDIPLNKISTFDIEKYKKHRRKEGRAKATINRELSNFSHLYTKAVEWKWINKKPSFTIKKYKEHPNRIVYLLPEEIHRLLKAARQDQNEYIYPFILIGLETGMRKSEILSIRLANINTAQKRIFVPLAKGGRRNQPITEKLADFLTEYTKMAEPNQEWLFPSSLSCTGHTVAIEKPYKRVVKTAGLDPKKIVRHTLRHTTITHLVQAGIDLPTIQTISGHKSIDMVLRYFHQNGEHIASAMNKLEKRYESTG